MSRRRRSQGEDRINRCHDDGLCICSEGDASNAGLVEADVVFSKVGGGAQRLQALLRGEQTATLLNAPLDGMAVSKGFVRLTTARSAMVPFKAASA